MNRYPHKPVHIRNAEQPAPYSYGNGVQPYSGHEHQPAAGFAPDSSYSPSPYLPATPAAPPAKSGAAGLLSKLDFNQIKATIDRMGGIEGILATVSKVQQVMQTVSQFGPMLKMIIPKFGSKSAEEEDDDYPRRRRRRRRRRPRGGSLPRRRRRSSVYIQTSAPRRTYSRRRAPVRRRRR